MIYIDKMLEIWLIFIIISALFSLLLTISTYNIFNFSNKKGVLSFIPIYNILILLDIVNMSKFYIILFFLPIVNILAMFLVMYRLSIVLHLSKIMSIGLIVFPIVFLPLVSYAKTWETEEEKKEEEKKEESVTGEMVTMLTEKEYAELNKLESDTPKVDNIFKVELKFEEPPEPFKAKKVEYNDNQNEVVEVKEEKIERVEPIYVQELNTNKFIKETNETEEEYIEIVEL